MFFFMEKPIKPENHTESEVTQYLSVQCIPADTDPLQYWKIHQTEFPILSKLACKYLSISALSAPVEIIFSSAGKVFRRRDVD